LFIIPVDKCDQAVVRPSEAIVGEELSEADPCIRARLNSWQQLVNYPLVFIRARIIESDTLNCYTKAAFEYLAAMEINIEYKI